jgi:NADPH2:quinone reductase
MRAVLCKDLTGPDSLVVEDLPSPEPGKGQVVVRTHAVALNFPDVLLVQGKYQFKPELPFSPGGEVAGEVIALGEGVDDLAVGDRLLTTMPWGGMREEVAVETANAIPIPDRISYETAAAFLTAYGTSHYALKQRAALQEGETLVVLGAAGGVGLAAVELGKAMGARVIACASSDEKLALCRERGADETINYSSEDLKTRIKSLTKGQGADVVYDPVGGPYSEPALRATGWSGRFLVVGFAAGEIPKIPLNLTLLKSCQIVGVFWGAFTMKERDQHLANVEELMDWLEAGKLKPHIGKTYPLEEASQALRDMMDRKAKGKLVLVP